MKHFAHYAKGVEANSPLAYAYFNDVAQKASQIAPELNINRNFSLGNTASLGVGPELRYPVNLMKFWKPGLDSGSLAQKVVSAIKYYMQEDPDMYKMFDRPPVDTSSYGSLD